MKIENLNKLVIGQEVICGNSLGRVKKIHNDFPNVGIFVDMYINNKGSKWDICNVEATDLRTGKKL